MGTLTKNQAIVLLRRQMNLISTLQTLSASAPEFAKWRRDTEVAIERIFGNQERHLGDFRTINFTPTFFVFSGEDESDKLDKEFGDCYAKGLIHARNILQSMIEEIESYWPKETGEPSKPLTDRELMERTIELAKQSVSEPDKVSPKVGAIVARDGIVLGEAYRGELGLGEHAEFTLLEKKLGGETLAGATLYTTLEPCTSRNHPKVPCAQWAIDRRIKKVFIGTLDRNPRVLGKGETTLLDAGIQIARFDPDLIPVIEELNRDFLRQHRRGVRRKRTKAETQDPVETEAVGPNGFKIGYTENGDKVEFIEEDGEMWPMILRRNDSDILEMYNELWEKVWYIRKIIRFEKMERGEIPLEDQNQPHLIKALERMKQIEEKYGVGNLGWPDVEWGIVQGKLSALSWVMGSEWEGSLDT